MNTPTILHDFAKALTLALRDNYVRLPDGTAYLRTDIRDHTELISTVVADTVDLFAEWTPDPTTPLTVYRGPSMVVVKDYHWVITNIWCSDPRVTVRLWRHPEDTITVGGLTCSTKGIDLENPFVVTNYRSVYGELKRIPSNAEGVRASVALRGFFAKRDRR